MLYFRCIQKKKTNNTHGYKPNDKGVYVGEVDSFHRLFKTQDPIIGYHEPVIDGLGETQPQRRFRERYEIIAKYLPC